jgi:hypothetical protein
MTTRLRIGHGNGRNKMSLVDFAESGNFDSCGLNEAHRLLRPLNRIPDYRLTHPGDGYADRRAASSVIVTKDDHDNLGELALKVSDALPAYPRFAPDRVMTCSMYSHPIADEVNATGVAHFNLHPNPLLGHGHNPDHPLTVSYAKALINTRYAMRTAQRMGFLLVLTGDLQVRPSFDEEWGPKELLAAPFDLNYWSVRIDWILFDPRLRLVRDPILTRLFDHTGFGAVLEPAA